MCTILGQHISIVRPARVAVIQRGRAWRGAKAAGRKTHKLSQEDKLAIAAEMGYELATEGRPLNRQGSERRQDNDN